MSRTLPAALVLSLAILLCACGGTPATAAEQARASDAPPHEIAVHVVDEDGRAVEGAHVGAMSVDQTMVETRTDAAGHATLRTSFESSLETIWAAKPGVGLDYLAVLGEAHHHEESAQEHKATEAEEEETEEAQEPADGRQPPPELQDVPQPIEFVLNGTRDVSVSVVDEDTQQSLPNSIVIPWYVYKTGKATEFNISGLREFMARTDERGTARLDILPIDNAVPTPLLVRSPGYVAHELFTVKPGKAAVQITAGLVRLVKVSGRVLAADGSPASGATVLAAGDGYHYGYFSTSAETRGDGTFEMEVSPHEYYSFVAQKDHAVSQLRNLIVRKGKPVHGLEIPLSPGTRVYGRVTGGPDELPIAGYSLRLCQQPAREYSTLSSDERLPNPKESRDYIQPLLERRTQTDDSGSFEFFVGAGRYYLVGPLSAPVPRFTVTDQEEVEVDLVAHEIEE